MEICKYCVWWEPNPEDENPTIGECYLLFLPSTPDGLPETNWGDTCKLWKDLSDTMGDLLEDEN